jgi:hypothetical protein
MELSYYAGGTTLWNCGNGEKQEKAKRKDNAEAQSSQRIRREEKKAERRDTEGTEKSVQSSGLKGSKFRKRCGTRCYVCLTR